jgi:hypothetical protein
MPRHPADIHDRVRRDVLGALALKLMQERGRRAGFLLGGAGGLVGSGLAAWGLSVASFPLFLAGSFLTGSYMAAQGFYRFAATDAASDAFRPKAISWVMAGGLISAITGPQLVKVTDDLLAIPFMGTTSSPC